MTSTDVLQIKLEIQGDGTVRAALADVGKSGEQAAKGTKSAAGGVQMLGQAIAAFGVQQMVTGFITVNREAEQLRVSLKTLEGSQAAATARFRELQEMAKTTPLSVNEVTATYIKLKNFGIDPMNGSMQAMVDQAAVLGGGIETLNGIVMAFGQANAKGKLQGEEMLQLAERGVPVYDTLARALNKTTGEVQELASKGQLGRDVIAQLIVEIGKNNFGAAAAQANTLDGAIGGLKDNIEQLAIAAGDSGLTAVLTVLIAQVSDGVQALTSLVAPTKELGTAADEAGGFIAGLSKGVLVVTAGAKVAGAGVGVWVDYLLALVDAARAAMIAVTGYYVAVGKAMTGDFSGASNAVKTSLEGSAAAFENAKSRVAAANSAFADTYDDIARQLGDDLDKLIKASEHAGEAVTKPGKAAAQSAGGVVKLTEEQKKAIAETERFIASLKRESEAHGKSEIQLLLEESARQKATAATQKQRDEIERLTKIRAMQLRQDEAAAKILKFAEDLLDDNAEALKQYASLLDQQARTLGGPATEAAMDYAAALHQISQAEQALMAQGSLSEEQVKKLAQARENASKIYGQSMQRAAMEQVSAYGRVWLQGISDLAPAITDGIMSGDWENVGERLGKSILGGLLETMLDQSVVKPIQQAFMNMLSGGDSGSTGMWGSLFDGLKNVFGAGASGTSGGSIAGGQGGGAMSSFGGALASNPVGWIIAGMALNAGLHGSGWRINEPGNASAAIGGTGNYALYGGPFGAEVMTTAMVSVYADKILQSLGMNGTWASAFSGSSVLAALFGRKAPEIQASGISGTYGFGGFEGQAFADIYQKGGLFSSSRRWTETAALDAAIDDIFDSAIIAVRRSAERLADSLGSDVSAALDAVRFNARLELSDDPEEAQRQIQEYVAQMMDSLSQAALDALGYAKLPKLAGISAADAMAGLQSLLGFMDDLQGRLDQLDSSPLVQLRLALEKLSSAESDALLKLEDALDGFNPAEIAEAAAQAEQAIVARYQAEIQMVRNLETALLTAQQQARQFDLAMAQRLAQAGGGSGVVVGAASVNMAASQTLVMGASDPERALAYLDEFVGNVDAWLQASIAQVNELAQAEQNRINIALAGIAQQQQAIAEALAALSAERNAIIAGATARATEAAAAANAQAQAIAQQQQAAAQAQINALQEQLSLAQQFASVVERARAMIQELTLGSANPLGAQARLALLDRQIAAAEATVNNSSGAAQAEAAAQLLALLQQRLSLVQSEGLMQRPGDDYLALYNDTLARIAAIEAMAGPQADLAIQLQEELNAIQSRTYEAVSTIAASVAYTAEEQARLNAIAEAETALQEEQKKLEEEAIALQEELLQVQRDAEAQIDDLNAQARSYYEWARAEGARLQAERAHALERQIELITHGQSIDEFIADRQAESTRLLTQISLDLRAFLDAISTDVQIPGLGGSPAPGPGGNPRFPDGPMLPEMAPITINTTNNITMTSADPAQVARAVAETMDRQIPQLATRIKREFSTA